MQFLQYDLSLSVIQSLWMYRFPLCSAGRVGYLCYVH